MEFKTLFATFGKEQSKMAASTTVGSLDESAIRYMEVISAKSSMKTKPVQLELRFYATATL